MKWSKLRSPIDRKKVWFMIRHGSVFNLKKKLWWLPKIFIWYEYYSKYDFSWFTFELLQPYMAKPFYHVYQWNDLNAHFCGHVDKLLVLLQFMCRLIVVTLWNLYSFATFVHDCCHAIRCSNPLHVFYCQIGANRLFLAASGHVITDVSAKNRGWTKDYSYRVSEIFNCQ